jgi:hypothetical protein
MKLTRLVCLVGVMALASPVCADVTLKSFAEAKVEGGNKWLLVQFYVFGAGQAYLAVNGKLVAVQHKTPLYCQPDHLALTGDNYVDIVEKQLQRWGVGTLPDDMSIAPVLLAGLEYTFPCTKS